LGVPYDASDPVIPEGSTVSATVEYLVPPAEKDVYYGESDYLTDLDDECFENTDMFMLLADENQLEVTATVGELARTYPVELDASAGETAVQFTLTGGLGYVPITIHGLARPDGWVFEQEQSDGSWEEIDQEVEGNDYWQAYYDAASDGYDLIFNLPNRETNEYRLVRP